MFGPVNLLGVRPQQTPQWCVDVTEIQSGVMLGRVAEFPPVEDKRTSIGRLPRKSLTDTRRQSGNAEHTHEAATIHVAVRVLTVTCLWLVV